MPLLMSAFSPKASIGPQSLHVRSGSKADMVACPSDVRCYPESGHSPGGIAMTGNGYLHGCYSADLPASLKTAPRR